MPSMVELKEDFFEAKFINFNNDFNIREFELFKEQLENYYLKRKLSQNLQILKISKLKLMKLFIKTLLIMNCQ